MGRFPTGPGDWRMRQAVERSGASVGPLFKEQTKDLVAVPDADHSLGPGTG